MPPDCPTNDAHLPNGVMMAMEYVQISEVPDLENALLIGAFAGWNDAASAACWAVKFLISQWEARPFAEMEPELFYDFSETRPKVRVVNGAGKRVTWPANRSYVFRAEREASAPKRRDIVLFLGEEPQLRWKTFTQEVLDVCRQCQVEELALLGSLVAEVPHTAPVQIAGTAGAAAMLPPMGSDGIERGNYEGDSGLLRLLPDTPRPGGV